MMHQYYYTVLGCTLTMCGVVFFVVQVLLNIMFAVYSDYRRRVAFRIMFHLGITDCILLLGFTYEGVVWSSDFHLDPLVEKIIGAFMRGGSDCNYCIQLVLAINRFVVFRPGPIQAPANVYTRMLCACWTCFFLPLAIYLLPVCSADLFNRARAWRNEPRCDDTFVGWVRTTEKVGKASTCVVTFLLYAATIWIMFNKRRRFSIGGSSTRRVTRSRSEQLERHILIYALCVFLAGFTSLMTGYFGSDDAVLISSDVSWQFSCITRSAFLLILNRELKRRFAEFIFRPKGKKLSLVEGSPPPVTVVACVSNFGPVGPPPPFSHRMNVRRIDSSWIRRASMPRLGAHVVRVTSLPTPPRQVSS